MEQKNGKHNNGHYRLEDSLSLSRNQIRRSVDSYFEELDRKIIARFRANRKKT